MEDCNHTTLVKQVGTMDGGLESKDRKSVV